MEHGKTGPHGLFGAERGACNEIRIIRASGVETLPHVSKGADIPIMEGEKVEVRTPGGGGYGPVKDRDPALSERDRRRGYVTAAAT